MSPRQQTDRPEQAHPQESVDPADSAAMGGERVESASDEIKRTVGALMPWGLSIIAHAALVGLAFYLVWQTIDVEQEQPTVPTLTQTPAVVPTPPIQDVHELPDAGGLPVAPIINQVNAVKPPTPGVTQPQPNIPDTSQWDNGKQQGPGQGDFDGDGWFDLPPGEPRTIDSNRRVVFVIDASGSMVDLLPFVIAELKQAIQKTHTGVRATIILFSGDGIFEVPGGGGVKGLRPLTPRFKQQINDWVTLANHRFDTGGRGAAYAAAALDRGLSYNPQAVYLLSDNLTGGGQGATRHEILQDDIMKVVRSHSKAAPPARIHTIQFLYEDPLVRAGLTGTLRLIADETGGTYQFKSQRDLNLR